MLSVLKNKRLIKKLTEISIPFLGILLVFGCTAVPENSQSLGSSEKIKDNEIKMNSEVQKAIKLETVMVQKQNIGRTITATGKVKMNENRLAVVGPIISGRVSQIYVNPGENVKKGQRLVEIESVELGIAKSQYYTAKTDYELASTDYERLKNLFAKKIGSEKEIITAEAEVKKTRSIFFTAEKQLHLMGLSEEDVHNLPEETHEINNRIYLVSPLDGIILIRNTKLGDKVSPESNLFEVGDMSVLWIDADIFENDIAKIRIGQQVEASVTAFPDEVCKGTVIYIDTKVDEETRTILVRTAIHNKDNCLKIGMFANIAIYLDENRTCIAIPRESVLDDSKNKIVFIKVGDSFTEQKVQLGSKYNGLIEVISGLSLGQEVVTKGNFQLLSEMHSNVFAGHIH